MSRNTGSRSCCICDRDVVLCGEPHNITKEEAGKYFDEYVGMIVADAVCPFCDAKYLAWVTNVKYVRGYTYTEPFVDLSFRHSFDDEPAAEDLPTPLMLQRVHLEQASAEAARAVEKLREMFTDVITTLESALAGPPRWESFRR